MMTDRQEALAGTLLRAYGIHITRTLTPRYRYYWTVAASGKQGFSYKFSSAVAAALNAAGFDVE